MRQIHRAECKLGRTRRLYIRLATPVLRRQSINRSISDKKRNSESVYHPHEEAIRGSLFEQITPIIGLIRGDRIGKVRIDVCHDTSILALKGSNKGVPIVVVLLIQLPVPPETLPELICLVKRNKLLLKHMQPGNFVLIYKRYASYIQNYIVPTCCLL